MGVEYVNVILVDNPLADPFDAELLSFTAKSGHEIALKAVLRKNEEEKVGVIGKSQGKLKVIEYSELSSEEGKARNEKGELRWALANLSLFCFRMDFIERIVQEKKELPWHFAKKEANLYARGMFYKAFIQKRETFIFDWLNFTDRAGALVYERERCFAPLKNKTGDASIETVRAALLESDRRIYQEISGLLPPKTEFELSQDFYYPSLQLLQKWKNRPLPDIDYIES
jgi:UDP-N-acetylglucosamine/UDP-N-acetylgalactosamine diphosphorylase